VSQSTEDKIIQVSRAVIDRAADLGVKLVLAESCTGGLVAAALTEISGSSRVLDRCLVTYSNEAKHQLLSVSINSLNKYGAVSPNTAKSMAIGALKNTPSASISAAVTGIAGPDGGTDYKPVGLVYFATKKRGKKVVTKKKILPWREGRFEYPLVG